MVELLELNEYLEGFFERRMDLNGGLASLFLTHPHRDHTRGVSTVLENFNPGTVVTNGQIIAGGRWDQKKAHEHTFGPDKKEATDDDLPLSTVTLKKLTEGSGLNYDAIDAVDCGAVDPTITVLWGQVSDQEKKYENPNNHSLAIRVVFGKASVLWTGDMEEAAIVDFVTRYSGSSELDVDVYQVGHHGSDNGTTEGLLVAASPEIAVISMGPVNREGRSTAHQYGHPGLEVVSLLNKHVKGSRKPLTADVATAAKKFRTFEVTKAIYATGWDGHIVLEANTKGEWSVLSTANGRRKINLNNATYDQLVALPGIGPEKASNIIEYRKKNKSFKSFDELDAVPGIGKATLANIAPYVIVE